MNKQRMETLRTVAQTVVPDDWCVKDWLVSSEPDTPEYGPGKVLDRLVEHLKGTDIYYGFSKWEGEYENVPVHYDADEVVLEYSKRTKGWQAVRDYFDLTAAEAYILFSPRAYVIRNPTAVRAEFNRRLDCLIRGVSITGLDSDV